MMHMTFYWGKKVTVLFDSWRTDSWLSYGLTLVALFLVSVFYQYMEDRRVRFKILSQTKPVNGSINTPMLPRAGFGRRNPARFATSLLFGVDSAIGYMLMLAIMSFNGGVFIAVILGLAFGYFLFRTGGAEEDDAVGLESGCACG